MNIPTHPARSGLVRKEVFGSVSIAGAFASGKNGSITASLTMEPPPATLDRPGNQTVELVSVSYSDIALLDVTNNIVAQADPPSLSQSGPECP